MVGGQRETIRRMALGLPRHPTITTAISHYCRFSGKRIWIALARKTVINAKRVYNFLKSAGLTGFHIRISKRADHLKS